MALSDRQLLDSLSRTPFVDSAELARILGEAHATVHRALTGLLADGIVGRVSHGTAHLPSSQRYYLTTNGIGETPGILGFATPSDFVRAYPVSREWLALATLLAITDEAPVGSWAYTSYTVLASAFALGAHVSCALRNGSGCTSRLVGLATLIYS